MTTGLQGVGVPSGVGAQGMAAGAPTLSANASSTLSNASTASTLPPPTTRRQVDPLLAGAIGLLLLLGILINFSASYAVALNFGADRTTFLVRQILWALIGLGAAGFMLSVDYRTWQRWSVLIMAGTLALLLLTLAIGVNRFGGERWLLAGGSVQPSEFVKLAVIIYIADWLSSKRDQIRDVTLGLLPFAILMGIVCGLVLLQNHMSTTILLALVATAMFFTAGAHIGQMLISGTVAGLVILALIIRSPYRFDRLTTYIDPWADPWGSGWQVIRSLESFYQGGLFGVGFGQGQEKHVLPMPHTDAIFAVIGEELGLAGCLVILGLFAIIAWRGFRVAAGVPTRFGSLLATGITCWIIGQALLNVAVATNFIPTTGIPLPFVSYGGSSLVASLAAVGLLLNVSRRVDPARVKWYGNLDLRWGDRRSRLSRTHRARRIGR